MEDIEKTETSELGDVVIEGPPNCEGTPTYYFRINPHDPTLHSKGADPVNAGKYSIKVTAPDSYVESDRLYCEVTFQPSGGSEVTIMYGEENAPFNGTSATKSNLAAGTYIFLAKADYDDDTHVEGPNGLTVTVP